MEHYRGVFSRRVTWANACPKRWAECSTEHGFGPCSQNAVRSISNTQEPVRRSNCCVLPQTYWVKALLGWGHDVWEPLDLVAVLIFCCALESPKQFLKIPMPGPQLILLVWVQLGCRDFLSFPQVVPLCSRIENRCIREDAGKQVSGPG